MSGTRLFAPANEVLVTGSTLLDLTQRALDDSQSTAAWGSPPASGVALVVDASAVVYSGLKSKRLRGDVRFKHLYLLAHACAPDRQATLDKLYVHRHGVLGRHWDGGAGRGSSWGA